MESDDLHMENNHSTYEAETDPYLARAEQDVLARAEQQHVLATVGALSLLREMIAIGHMHQEKVMTAMNHPVLTTVCEHTKEMLNATCSNGKVLASNEEVPAIGWGEYPLRIGLPLTIFAATKTLSYFGKF